MRRADGHTDTREGKGDVGEGPKREQVLTASRRMMESSRTEIQQLGRSQHGPSRWAEVRQDGRGAVWSVRHNWQLRVPILPSRHPARDVLVPSAQGATHPPKPSTLARESRQRRPLPCCRMDRWVSFLDHGQRVRPTRPVCCNLRPALRNPMPPRAKGVAVALAISSQRVTTGLTIIDWIDVVSVLAFLM